MMDDMSKDSGPGASRGISACPGGLQVWHGVPASNGQQINAMRLTKPKLKLGKVMVPWRIQGLLWM